MSSAPATQPGSPLNSSTRAKTIVFAIVGILALAGVGVLAGALVDSDDAPLEVEVVSGGPTDDLRPQVVSTPTPTPSVGSTPAPTPAPTPTPTATTPPASGESLVVGGGAVTVPIPAGWTGSLTTDGSEQAFLRSGQGDLIWIGVFDYDPAQADASAILSSNIAYWLPPESYSQLQTTQVTAQTPFGNLLSVAGMGYQGLLVDAQGTFPVRGNMWVALRGDGKTLAITADATPAERFAAEAWRPVVDGAFNNFAGTGG